MHRMKIMKWWRQWLWLVLTLVTKVTSWSNESSQCEVDSVGYVQSHSRRVKASPQVGALCCPENACQSADLVMESPFGPPFSQCPPPCILDVCCDGPGSCSSGTFRNPNTVSCADGACFRSTFSDIAKNVFCSAVSGGGITCQRATFEFLGGENHFVACQDNNTACNEATFTYSGTSIVNHRCDGFQTCFTGRINVGAGTLLRLECLTPQTQPGPVPPRRACESLEVFIAGGHVDLVCDGPDTCNVMRIVTSAGGSCTCQPSNGAGCPPVGGPFSPCPAGNANTVPVISPIDPPCCVVGASLDCANCGCDISTSSTTLVTTSTTPTTTCPPCNCSGNVTGDPHIATLVGQKYLLLQQGTFSFWRFSGLAAESRLANSIKRLPVDFNIYAHYSGHSSYTKAFLLVDSSGVTVPNVLEMTADTCEWRSKSPGAVWRKVEGPQLLSSPDSDGDEMTAFKILKGAAGRMHIELLMKQVDGSFKKICQLFVLCKPRHFINAKMSMLQEDLRFVHGQIGPHGGQDVKTKTISLLQQGHRMQERTDQEFLISQRWTQLGGSEAAALYLSQSDDEPGLSLLEACDVAEAEALCQKHLGNLGGAQTFDDCVFDVCHGGEVAAELTAELLTEE